MFTITSIVEGHGEIDAVRLVLNRLVYAIRPKEYVRVATPTLLPRGLMTSGPDDKIAQRLNLAAAEIGDGPGIVLIALDADDDAACEIGPLVLARAVRLRGDVTPLVCVFEREFEVIYLASITELRGRCGIPNNAVPPSNPETIRDAKGTLARIRGTPYSPRIDQARFAAAFDLDAARAVTCFARLWLKLKQHLA